MQTYSEKTTGSTKGLAGNLNTANDSSRNGAGRPPGKYALGLKRLRVQRDLTLAQVAYESGLHQDTVSRLENLRRGADLKTIYKLARVLGASYDEIVDDVPTDTHK